VGPKGVIASYLEVAIFRKECGDVIALENALNAASDVKSLCFCQGGYRGGFGSKRRRMAKKPRLPYGSIEKGRSVMLASFMLAVGPWCRPWNLLRVAVQ
jgi:hypothetical protein